MLPKRKRLSAHEVEEVLARGVSVRSPIAAGQKPLISAKFLAIPGPFRAAVVVPKSLARKATERNRLRRAVYRAIAGSPAPKKVILAVFFVRNIPKKPLTPAFFTELEFFFKKLPS